MKIIKVLTNEFIKPFWKVVSEIGIKAFKALAEMLSTALKWHQERLVSDPSYAIALVTAGGLFVRVLLPAQIVAGLFGDFIREVFEIDEPDSRNVEWDELPLSL